MTNIKAMTPQLKSTLLLTLLALILTAPVAQADEVANEQDTSEGSGVTDYIAMDPPFVTHVGAPSHKPTYLKASVSLRTSTSTARAAIETHMPRLRHELVMLFGEQTNADQLTSLDGQQALREEAKKRMNEVLERQQTGESITGVLFTEFVVQR
ncbi:flagellar basal body-associated FliL family protein [Marinobacter salinisoli]|uniref:Flagellar protein FliL n=1 Tax=Marinobacter salinisoli TaxID=2769486 RepID=A0ABX7MWI4_9GAMM|nr:flagellar basal body-associated FliL family protein [Marinobacter salinisoli]QSP95852.1 flagellar basal body-associated FliL family protein [Marinobacter salinisoli]